MSVQELRSTTPIFRSLNVWFGLAEVGLVCLKSSLVWLGKSCFGLVKVVWLSFVLFGLVEFDLG